MSLSSLKAVATQMKISLESPNQPDVIRLIEELDAYQMPLYPAESHHGVDLKALSEPNVLFAVARDDNQRAVACGAIIVEDNFGELKRFYTMPSSRGKGIAGSLLSFLELEAKLKGCNELALETGNRQPEAISMYSKFGYELCRPFGMYIEDPSSVFMKKIL